MWQKHGTSTLVLSCIDYRFVHGIPEVLCQEEEVDEYDQFSLAGGSLGYNQSIFPDWPQTWLDHVALARSLHSISQIVLVEHMDCGMYKQVYPGMTPSQERQHHLDNMLAFQTAMNSVLPFPLLPIRGYLLYLDGSSERLI
jgi:carbonic anhydrase